MKLLTYPHARETYPEKGNRWQRRLSEMRASVIGAINNAASWSMLDEIHAAIQPMRDERMKLLENNGE